MVRSIASAPGKVILYGEHAVVYGVTAIAAALSDLRIVVILDTIVEPHLEIHMPDAGTDENGIIVEYNSLTTILPHRTDPLSPIVPSEGIIQSLRTVFVDKSETLSQGLMSISFLAANILPECLWGVGTPESRRGIKVTVKSEGLPIGAGLGSSASFSVSMSAALLRLRQLMFGDIFPVGFPPEEIAGDGSAEGWAPPNVVLNMLNGWAYAAEVVIHGEPSGLDNTTSCFGGAVRLNRSLGRFETLPHLPTMNILLTNTKSPRKTKLLVKQVRELNESLPTCVKPIFESIEAISQEFLHMIEPVSEHTDNVTGGINPQNDKKGMKKTVTSQSAPAIINQEKFISTVKKLFSINHGLLCAIGVGHRTLNAVVDESLKYNMAAKLTGAGGGGCAITLVTGTDKELEQLRDALWELGFDTYISKVGGYGVKWHGHTPPPAPASIMRVGRDLSIPKLLTSSEIETSSNDKKVSNLLKEKNDKVNSSSSPTTTSGLDTSQEVTKTKKSNGNSAIYFVGNIVSLSVMVGFLSIAFEKNHQNIAIAMIAFVLGYICMKITSLVSGR